MKTLKYTGYGRRIITNQDFYNVGVEAEGFDVVTGDIIDVTDDTALWLTTNREAFVEVPDTNPDASEDNEIYTTVEAPTGEEPGTSVDPSSPDVKSKPGE